MIKPLRFFLPLFSALCFLLSVSVHSQSIPVTDSTSFGQSVFSVNNIKHYFNVPAISVMSGLLGYHLESKLKEDDTETIKYQRMCYAIVALGYSAWITVQDSLKDYFFHPFLLPDQQDYSQLQAQLHRLEEGTQEDNLFVIVTMPTDGSGSGSPEMTSGDNINGSANSLGCCFFRAPHFRGSEHIGHGDDGDGNDNKPRHTYNHHCPVCHGGRCSMAPGSDDREENSQEATGWASQRCGQCLKSGVNFCSTASEFVEHGNSTTCGLIVGCIAGYVCIGIPVSYATGMYQAFLGSGAATSFLGCCLFGQIEAYRDRARARAFRQLRSERVSAEQNHPLTTDPSDVVVVEPQPRSERVSAEQNHPLTTDPSDVVAVEPQPRSERVSTEQNHPLTTDPSDVVVVEPQPNCEAVKDTSCLMEPD